MDDIPFKSHAFIPFALIQNDPNQARQADVDDTQKHGNNHNEEDHDSRRTDGLFPRRPSDLFQFDFNFPQKLQRLIQVILVRPGGRRFYNV